MGEKPRTYEEKRIANFNQIRNATRKYAETIEAEKEKRRQVFQRFINMVQLEMIEETEEIDSDPTPYKSSQSFKDQIYNQKEELSNSRKGKRLKSRKEKSSK